MGWTETFGNGGNLVGISSLESYEVPQAGIVGASSHSGRRQFITTLAENQVNVRVIQALARHRHLNTTMRYIDVNDRKLEKAVEVVGV